jgi:uncharacterized iron-regulated membrane protein
MLSIGLQPLFTRGFAECWGSELSDFLSLLAGVVTLIGGVATFLFGYVIYRGKRPTWLWARQRRKGHEEYEKALRLAALPLDVIQIAERIPMSEIARDSELREMLLATLALFRRDEAAADYRAAMEALRRRGAQRDEE